MDAIRGGGGNRVDSIHTQWGRLTDEGMQHPTQHQVDNFYLDMNGIIHMCTHANAEELILLDERKMFQRIFTYTDRLYKIVAPTRVGA